jgi:hypothetical protein
VHLDLTEFRIIVDAVTCAVVVQRGMAARNTTVQEDRRIVFRIGISSARFSLRNSCLTARRSRSTGETKFSASLRRRRMPHAF